MKTRKYARCTDDELEEEYIAELIEDSGKKNQPVRVVAVLRYPIQHAIIWTDVPNEVPAFRFGAVTILTVREEVRPGEVSEEEWQRTCERAIRARLRMKLPDAERAILERHLEGKIKKERRTIYARSSTCCWRKANEN